MTIIYKPSIIVCCVLGWHSLWSRRGRLEGYIYFDILTCVSMCVCHCSNNEVHWPFKCFSCATNIHVCNFWLTYFSGFGKRFFFWVTGLFFFVFFFKERLVMNLEECWHQMDARFCTIVQYRCCAWWGRLRRTAGVVEAGDEHTTRDRWREKRRERSCLGKEKKKMLNLPPITICSNSQNAFSVFPAKNHLNRVVFIVEKKHLITTASTSAFKTAVQRRCWSEINV